MPSTIFDHLAELKARFAAENPQSRSAFDERCKVFPGGTTRSVLYFDPFPITIARGSGQFIWDEDDHCYLDLLGDYSAGFFGHSNPCILGAIRTALEQGLTLSGPNRFEGELARQIQQRFPSMELLRFCNSGTEANLLALCFARATTGRSRVVVFANGYHGSVFYYPANISPGLNAPFDTVTCPFNRPVEFAAAMRENQGQIAAVIVELMQASGGAVVAHPDFVQTLRDETKRNGSILIFDEVMTSRLAVGGLQATYGVEPDITTLGKYLGGGLSFGAFGGRASLMNKFDLRCAGALAHAGTFNNNVLSMAAGAAGLREVLTPSIQSEVNARGDRLRHRLNEIASMHRVPCAVTGMGSLMNVRIGRNALNYLPSDKAQPVLRLLHLYLLLVARTCIAPRGFITVSLPVTDADAASLCDAFDRFCSLHKTALLGFEAD